jgi:transposase InsO family protein
VLVTPVRAPKANAYAERWVRTVRADCLDWLLVVGRGHLEQILRIYVKHYNEHRPHPCVPQLIAGSRDTCG